MKKNLSDYIKVPSTAGTGQAPINNLYKNNRFLGPSVPKKGEKNNKI